MKKCNEECYPLCDFCIHYNFNGEDIKDESGKVVAKGAIYVGKGFCTKHHRQQDPEDSCEDFHCENADRNDNL